MNEPAAPAPAAGPDAVQRRARQVVALLFLLNALGVANVVPRLPGIKADLGLSNTGLGTAIAAGPTGALVMGLATGALVHRFGSARVTVGSAIGIAAALPAVGIAPAWWALAGVMFVLGGLDALMDVAMNAHALRVQHGYGRSIINAFHGVWSIGAVIGGVVGSVAAGLGVPLTVHLGAIGLVIAGLALIASRGLLPGPDPHGEGEPAEGHPLGGLGRAVQAAPVLLVLGVILVLASAIEDTPATWGAVYLRDELGTAAGAAGAVFVCFQSCMTVGRLLGDRVVDRWGPVRVARAGGALTCVSVTAGLAIGEPASVVAGFALAGIGTAPLYPLVFSAAGHQPAVRSGDGLAVVASAGRVGFLLAPPLVGVVGDTIGLRAGLLAAPAAAVGVVLLAGALRPRVQRVGRALPAARTAPAEHPSS